MTASSIPTPPATLLSTEGMVGELHRILKRTGDATIERVKDSRPGASEADVPFLLLPEGRKPQSLKPLLDEFRRYPERRTGESTLRDERSFIQLVNRFKGAESAIFADPTPDAPSLLAIFDYHEPGGPRAGTPGWGHHRARYAIQMSDEWLAWHEADGKDMDQGAFAEFLEDRIQDVRLVDTGKEPKLAELVELLGGRIGGSAAIMQLSRGLSVSRGIAVKQAVTLATGEVNVQFTETHADGNGAPITTPNLFFIGIPVFYGGEGYRIAVRLRYRFAGSRLTWSIHLHRPDLVFDDAFLHTRNRVADVTELPIFVGTPER